MRRATSLQTPPHPYAHARPTATVAVNGIAMGAWCARMVAMGGGIFAKTAKTPPLQSGVCGDGIAIRIAPKGRPLPPPSCAYHASPHAAPHEPVVLKRRGTLRRYGLRIIASA